MYKVAAASQRCVNPNNVTDGITTLLLGPNGGDAAASPPREPPALSHSLVFLAAAVVSWPHRVAPRVPFLLRQHADILAKHPKQRLARSRSTLQRADSKRVLANQYAKAA